MKILITGGNSAKALKLLTVFKEHEIVFADYGDVPILKTADYKFISLGIKDENTTSHQLLKVCLDEGVNEILPLYPFEIQNLENSKTIFEEFNIQILLPLMTHNLSLIKDVNLSNNIVAIKNGDLIYGDKSLFELHFSENKIIRNGVFYGNEKDFSLFTI
ncbi:MAG: hypothetical protein K2Q03_06425 [Sphingobacteriaceae bacterium]|nr:hypothetical protein [Sphingobacteriaceae bacterium]